MPVVGTVCCRTGENSSFEECIQCAKTGKPGPCVYPLHLLESMRQNEAGRKDAGLSVTTLLGCHRRAQLHASEDYYEDPGNVEARFKGTLVHEGMERIAGDQDGVIMEKRFGRAVGQGLPENWGKILPLITGKMDMILTEYDGGARIVDFKSAGRRSLHPDMVPTESHVQQVNVYRWILEGNGFEVGSAAILYIGDTGMQEVEIPLWPIEMANEFVLDNVEKYNSQRLAPILPDRVIRKRSTAKQAHIVWSDDEEVPEDSGPMVEVLPHYYCTNCALFDICRSKPLDGVDWDEGEDDGHNR